jgi:hypothetical protein
MSTPLSALQWLVRAEEARIDVAAIRDPQARCMMLLMAVGYERMAEHAASLERLDLPHEVPRADFQLRGFRGTPRSW